MFNLRLSGLLEFFMGIENSTDLFIYFVKIKFYYAFKRTSRSNCQNLLRLFMKETRFLGIKNSI